MIIDQFHPIIGGNTPKVLFAQFYVVVEAEEEGRVLKFQPFQGRNKNSNILIDILVLILKN